MERKYQQAVSATADLAQEVEAANLRLHQVCVCIYMYCMYVFTCVHMYCVCVSIHMRILHEMLKPLTCVFIKYVYVYICIVCMCLHVHTCIVCVCLYRYADLA